MTWGLLLLFLNVTMLGAARIVPSIQDEIWIFKNHLVKKKKADKLTIWCVYQGFCLILCTQIGFWFFSCFSLKSRLPCGKEFLKLGRVLATVCSLIFRSVSLPWSVPLGLLRSHGIPTIFFGVFRSWPETMWIVIIEFYPFCQVLQRG